MGWRPVVKDGEVGGKREGGGLFKHAQIEALQSLQALET
jgi:hypothetical protein